MQKLHSVVLAVVVAVSAAPAAFAQGGEPVVLRLPEQDISITRQKFVDVDTGALDTVNEALFADGSVRVLSDREVEDLARGDALLHRTRVGAIRESFQMELLGLLVTDPTTPIRVATWPPVDPNEIPLGPSLEALRDLDDDESDTMVAARKTEVASVSDRATAPLATAMRDLGATGLRVSPLAPVVYADMTPAQILALAARIDEVGWVYEGVAKAEPELTTSTCAMGADIVESRGVDADSLEAAVVEPDQVQGGLPCLERTGFLGDALVANHPTAVAGIIGSTLAAARGVAPSINILSGDIDANLFTVDNIEDGLDWALDNGADVFNMSFGTDDSGDTEGEDVLVDWFIRHHRRLLVKSAGNFPDTCESMEVTSPGMGFNILTVGNYDDGGTCGTSDDTISSSSCFGDPTSPHGDREKPEVAAPGASITTLSTSVIPGVCQTLTSGGTSFSAPHVTGTAALLVQRVLGLKHWPEALKAVIMSSALNNIEGSARLSEKDGTGGIQAEIADGVVTSGRYDARIVSYADFTPSSFVDVASFFVDNTATRLKIATVWDSNPGGTDGFFPNNLHIANDFDLQVWRQTSGGPVFVATSDSYDNSYETVDIASPAQGDYTLRVVLAAGTLAFPIPGSEYLATAWTIVDPCDGNGGDADDDTVCGNIDNCLSIANGMQANSDGDLLGDACDNCPLDTNPGQEDLDHDKVGDICDPDIDNDGCENGPDLDDDSPVEKTGIWIGIGGFCNPDSGIQYGFAGLDSDNDGDLNCEETDNDGDGVPDGVDPCPNIANGLEVLCTTFVSCPVSLWWDVCLFGGCNELFLRLSSLINPAPFEVDTIEIVNQAIIAFPAAGMSIQDLVGQLSGISAGQSAAQGSGPAGEERLRLELWRRNADGDDRFVALIAEYLPSDVAVGGVAGGIALKIAPTNLGDPSSTSLVLDTVWTAGADPEDVLIDEDVDEIPNPLDNCLGISNSSQTDTDGDAFGNACDPDYDQNARVGISDFNRLRSGFGRRCRDAGYDPVLDADDNCAIGLSDFNPLRSLFGREPGPSGRACVAGPCP